MSLEMVLIIVGLEIGCKTHVLNTFWFLFGDVSILIGGIFTSFCIQRAESIGLKPIDLACASWFGVPSFGFWKVPDEGSQLKVPVNDFRWRVPTLEGNGSKEGFSNSMNGVSLHHGHKCARVGEFLK